MSENIAQYDRATIDCVDTSLTIESVDYLMHSVATRPLESETLSVESFNGSSILKSSSVGHSYDPETGQTTVLGKLVLRDLEDDDITSYHILNEIFDYLHIEAEYEECDLDFYQSGDTRKLAVYLDTTVQVLISCDDAATSLIVESRFANDGTEGDDAYANTAETLKLWALAHGAMLWMTDADRDAPTDYKLTVHSSSQNSHSYALFRSIVDNEAWGQDMGITDLPFIDYERIDFHGIGSEMARDGIDEYALVHGAVRSLICATRGRDEDGNVRTLDGSYFRSAVLGRL